MYRKNIYARKPQYFRDKTQKKSVNISWVVQIEIEGDLLGSSKLLGSSELPVWVAESSSSNELLGRLVRVSF